MNLFQNNTYKNEFIITENDILDGEGQGFTLLASSDEFSLNEEGLSEALTSAIKEYGGGDVTDGYSVQVS